MAKTAGDGGNAFARVTARGYGRVVERPKAPDIFANFGIAPPVVSTKRKTPTYGIPNTNIVQRHWPKKKRR